MQIYQEIDQIPLGIHIKQKRAYSVMIVDDSPMERLLLKKFLLHEKFQIVSECSDGQDAIDNLEKLYTKPDILFVDYKMPHKNGVEVIQEVRPYFPEMVIIMITAHTHKELVKELSQIKINALVAKPYTREQIYDKLSLALGRLDKLKNKNVQDTKSNAIDLKELSIPPLKSVVAQVMLFDANGSSEKLETIIAPDKAISSSIIRIANSSYYGRNSKVTRLKDGITLLGTKTIKNLVSLHAQKTVGGNIKGELFQKHLKELPVLTALLSFDIASPIGKKTLRNELFLSSLLCRIGMNILAVNYSRKYQDILKLLQVGIRGLYEIELEELGTNSIEVGKKVFKAWKMPEHFSKIIENMNFQQTKLGQIDDLSVLVRLSDILAREMLGIFVGEEDVELKERIFSHYSIDEESRQLFGEDYYTMIKEHPYFSLANE